MNAVGLPNWIANNKDEFVVKAVEFANDLQSLHEIRNSLRQQLLNSPLGNAQKFAKNLENVFKTILQKHQIIEQKNDDDMQTQSASEQLESAILEVYNNALYAHENGQYEEAAKGYLEILNINNKHPEANHHLGVIETHTKSVDFALPRFEAAVMAKPESEQFWVSYIDALIISGNTQTALSAIHHGQQYGLSASMAQTLEQEIDEQLKNKNINLNFQNNSERKTKSIKFIIVAPAYTDKSAGIVVLHQLCDYLNNIGYPSAICFTGLNGFNCSNDKKLYGPNLKWYSLRDKNELDKFINEGVVIYPEIVSGNPLNANRVVRYLLNSEGFVAKNTMQASDKDFLLAFQDTYHPNPHAILTKPCHFEVFNTDNSLPVMERKMDMTYIGKGAHHGECFVLPNTVELSRTWPKTREELALLLKNTRYLFTWDYRSQTVTDAMLCGVIPIFMSLAPFKSFEDLHPDESPNILRTSASLENGEVKVNMPDDIEQRLNQVLSGYYVLLKAFDNSIDNVLSKIIKHFEL